MCGRVFFALKIAIRKAYDSELKSRGALGGKLSRNRSEKLLHKKISRVFFCACKRMGEGQAEILFAA